jgi:hypothetical protein
MFFSRQSTFICKEVLIFYKFNLDEKKSFTAAKNRG